MKDLLTATIALLHVTTVSKLFLIYAISKYMLFNRIVNIIVKRAAIAVQQAQPFLIICNRAKKTNIAVSRVANFLPSKFLKDQEKANIAKAVDNFFLVKHHVHRRSRLDEKFYINPTV